MGGRGENFNNRQATSYSTHSSPITVTIPLTGSTDKSYGEGNIRDSHGNYHVYLTDEYGGRFVDKGTVDGYKIGTKVELGDGKVGTIIAAHIYPNGGTDYNIQIEDRYSRRGYIRRQYEKRLLDQNNKRK